MNQSEKNFQRKPELSVIIPVYNTEFYLGEAIDSILRQDFRDFEIIAINDGSSDQSGKILDRFRDSDPRVHVYHRENVGLSATRNFGFEKANGNFVYFFDSDDLLVKGAIGRLISLMQETGSQIISFSGECIDEGGENIDSEKLYHKPDFRDPIPGKKLYRNMMRLSMYSPVVSMYIFKKSFIQSHQLYFSDGFLHEDEAYTIQALCMAEKALSVSEIYYKHRHREGSIMSRMPGLKNLEGWTEAVSQMLLFLNKTPIDSATEELVLARARLLTHNSIRTIHELNRRSENAYSITNYFSQSELKRLGVQVRFRNKMPGLFKIYNWLKKVLTIPS